jgi:hypothetical protein
MKIGRLNISFTKPKGVAVKVVSERYKAQYDKQASSKPKRQVFYQGQNSWKARCEHNDKLADDYSIAKMAPFGLAGLVTAQGVWFKPAVNKNDETYPLAEEALYRCEKFRREQLVNSKFYDTVYRMAKYGGCFWEITTDPEYSFRIAPMQECIEPAEADDQGNITRWVQYVNGTKTAEWTSKELVLVPFIGVTTSTWPYAPSIYAGLDNELEMLTGLEESANEYSKKQAWPYEVLQLGDNENPVSDEAFSDARSEWKGRQPGEGLVTDVPTQILAGGTGSAPIRELATLADLMKDNVVDSVMIPPVSKLYNSTEASSKEMNKNTMTTLGQPVQWIITSYFCEYILKPMLEAAGFSRKSCPEVVFESPDVHKVEDGQFWTSLVSAKIATPMQAAEHLGIEYDQDYFDEQLKLQQEQFKQQLDVKADVKAKQVDNAPNDAKPNPVDKQKEEKPIAQAKEFDEWIVRKRKPL